MRGLETLRASQSVVAARTAKIHTAICSPPDADLAEFARLVPEKIDAFSHSSVAFAQEAVALQGVWLQQFRSLCSMMLPGKVLNAAQAAMVMQQMTELALSSIVSSARLGRAALAPVHSVVTDNDRRLCRSGVRT